MIYKEGGKLWRVSDCEELVVLSVGVDRNESNYFYVSMGGSSELPLPSLLMFRPLLPNEDPEVSYEPTTDFYLNNG